MRRSYIILTARVEQRVLRAILRTLPLVHFLGELDPNTLECTTPIYSNQEFPRIHFDAKRDEIEGKWFINVTYDVLPARDDSKQMIEDQTKFPDPNGILDSNAIYDAVKHVSNALYKQGVKTFVYDPFFDEFPDGMNTSFLDEQSSLSPGA